MLTTKQPLHCRATIYYYYAVYEICARPYWRLPFVAGLQGPTILTHSALYARDCWEHCLAYHV